MWFGSGLATLAVVVAAVRAEGRLRLVFVLTAAVTAPLLLALVANLVAGDP